jgi:predicted N-acetyltransferase YhbS
MLKISKVTKKNLTEVKQFETKEWHKLDKEHYGAPQGEYMDKNFRFVATENGKIVGTISGECELGMIFIAVLIVAQKRYGQGIGQKLLDKAKKFGKRLGCHKIYLFTGKNWKANRFYKTLGFKKIAELPKHYLKHDFYIYEKGV